MDTVFSIKHVTDYKYSNNVNLAYNEAKLTPRSFQNPLLEQICLDSRLTIVPGPQDERRRSDSFGNQVNYFSFSHNHKAMTVTSNSVVKRSPRVPKERLIQYLQTQLHDLEWRDSLARIPAELVPFTLNSSLIPFMPELKAYAKPSFEKYALLFDALHDLMQRIFADFTFKAGVTTVTTPLDKVAKSMTGVCQDYSHFMIACVRSMGLACRYVSGYLETVPPPGEEKLQGVDASHAWVAVYLPGFAWLDFDPTNNLIPLAQHVTVAWGRDYADVPPLKGVLYSNGSHELNVAVDMVRREIV